MALIVQKYGGTSVGTPERIQKVAERISRYYSQGHRLVVVVSAMGHTTDELIDLAHRVSNSPPHREMDMLLTAGERISMALLSMALWDQKVPALSFTGSQTGIITDESHRRARIRRILGDRVRAAVSTQRVAIIAGFQGVSESKEITTLGRGGSDTTAVALAAALQAEACEIYTDVDGVFSADPRMVRGARLWKSIPHDLMVEMATCGAGVLHPRSVELAKKYKVPLWVKNSLNENEGTILISREGGPKDRGSMGMEEYSVVGVTSDRDKCFITASLTQPSSLQKLWNRAGDAHLAITAPLFSDKEVRFFSDRESENEWRRYLTELQTSGALREFEIKSDIVPLSVVGDRFSDSKALYQMMQILEREGIPVFSGSASALTITLGIPLNRVEDGVKALHAELLEEVSKGSSE